MPFFVQVLIMLIISHQTWFEICVLIQFLKFTCLITPWTMFYLVQLLIHQLKILKHWPAGYPDRERSRRQYGAGHTFIPVVNSFVEEDLEPLLTEAGRPDWWKLDSREEHYKYQITQKFKIDKNHWNYREMHFKLLRETLEKIYIKFIFIEVMLNELWNSAIYQFGFKATSCWNF